MYVLPMEGRCKIMARITSTSISYKRTVNLGNYENVVIEAQLAADLEPGDNLEEVMRALWTVAVSNVRMQEEVATKPAEQRRKYFLGLTGAQQAHVQVGAKSDVILTTKDGTETILRKDVISEEQDDPRIAEKVGKFWLMKSEALTDFQAKYCIVHGDNFEEVMEARDELDFPTVMCQVVDHAELGYTPIAWFDEEGNVIEPK